MKPLISWLWQTVFIGMVIGRGETTIMSDEGHQILRLKVIGRRGDRRALGRSRKRR